MTQCSGRPNGMAWLMQRRGLRFALVWAPLLLAAPLAGALAERDWARAATLVILGLAYAGTVWLPSRESRWSEIVLLLFGVLCTAYLAGWRTDREFVFPLLAIAIAVAVRARWALGLVGSLAVSGAVAAGLQDRSVDAALALAFATFFGGAATFLVRHLVGVVDELSRTRQQLAGLAVAEERSRFSRDLHDLLGHTLSVMVVKAQAARRLADRDAAAAAEHARDIESIGRQALTEVREAVAGYRAVRLQDELSNARAALAAGDVQVEITPPNGELPSDVDALFGWVVREGTTNVLRHAGARHCRITVTSRGGAADVEILDDGHGADAGDGTGLRGLRERAAGLGGAVTATTTASGFRLAVSVPILSSPTGRVAPR